jgi:hypothetical protein
MSTTFQIIYNFGAPLTIVIGYLGLMLWEDRRRSTARGERVPIGEKLLRPAGYGLSQKLDQIRTDFAFDFAGATMCACGIGMALTFPLPFQISVGSAIGFAIAMILALVSCTRKIAAARSYSLGLKGELLVAQWLSEVLADGYRVFHDYPDGAWGNIDHVVVGSGGVFAIETKMRKKRRTFNGKSDFKVFIDGEHLDYGWCKDHEAVGQTRKNAAALAKYLTSATGEPIQVTPVLAIPGWWVEAKTRNDVVALSGRGLPCYIRKLPNVLSASEIQKIAYQVDQKCRDVEV